ncbi:uncharacterized protein Dana_GF21660 [Drosophila ananassae]|uniref:Integrase catalytic domain-containing protein n=1 Tax=Drosophila ananassae TaxID=7217 RepID=A0A0N8P252_DROAN|nr:uncharacterized protein Dana_GF21660 [Drosophila ananassae]
MDLAKHVTKLSGATDWPIWKRKIRDLIHYHDGALDALDGKIVKPDPLPEGASTADKKKHKEKSDFFRKANSYAKSMITTAVTDSVYQKIMDKETAHDTWEALKNQFEATAKDQNKRNDEKESQEAFSTTAKKEHHQDSGASGRRFDTCRYCKKKGHWVRNCIKWKKDGRPKPSYQNAEQGNCAEPTVTLVSVHNGVFAAEANSGDDWWIDNGATKHVVKTAKYFEHFEKFENPILAAQDNNPSSRFESSATECTLKINDKIVLVGARKVGGTLYRAAIEPILPERNVEVNVATSETSILQLYHERWGHQDKNHIKDMLKREMGIQVKLESSFSEPCTLGKAHRLPFGTRKPATKPGELMSGDVCGPFEDSFQKKRYLVVFKDHFTRFRYGYIVKQKSEVKDVLRHMVSHAKQQGHTIREFLSDNGGEFDCAGVRETLQEAEAIWAELVSTAVYVLNRTGKSSLEGLSPYQLWLGKKRRIKHLRIVGSTSYVHIPCQKRKKMDEKAEKGYLVGYDGDERYRIYLPEKHKVVVSRDVKFQEKFSNCEPGVNLPFQDFGSKDVVEDKEEEDANLHKSEDEDTLQEQDLSKDTAETGSEDNYETGVETSFDEENNKRKMQSMRLRDRSKLKRPEHMDDYVAAAENFVLESPDSFHEAINSNGSELFCLANVVDYFDNFGFDSILSTNWRESSINGKDKRKVVTVEELRGVAQKLVPNKAPDPDAVPNRTLRIVLALISEIVAAMHNQWLRE